MKQLFSLVLISLSLLATSCAKSKPTSQFNDIPKLSQTAKNNTVEQLKLTIYTNTQYSFSFNYPSSAEITEKRGISKIMEFHDNHTGLQFWINIYNKDFYLQDRNNYQAQDLLKVTKNFETFKEDRSLENKSINEPDSGPYYSNTLKLRINNLPAIDFRSSSTGGTERIISFIKNENIYEIYCPDAFLFQYDLNEAEKARYELLEIILKSFQFTGMSF